MNIFSNKVYAELIKNHDPQQGVIKTFDDIKGSLKYDPDEYFLFSPHIGQRKLCLTTVWYLTQMKATDEICLYVGSAPNIYAWELHKLFPKLKFVYVDPRPH